MSELNINMLENCFKAAKEKNKRFVGVKISMQGFPSPEVIINERENFDLKLSYYKSAYNENLTLGSYESIKIVGFTYGDSYEDIQKDLIGED